VGHLGQAKACKVFPTQDGNGDFILKQKSRGEMHGRKADELKCGEENKNVETEEGGSSTLNGEPADSNRRVQNWGSPVVRQPDHKKKKKKKKKKTHKTGEARVR